MGTLGLFLLLAVIVVVCVANHMWLTGAFFLFILLLFGIIYGGYIMSGDYDEDLSLRNYNDAPPKS